VTIRDAGDDRTQPSLCLLDQSQSDQSTRVHDADIWMRSGLANRPSRSKRRFQLCPIKRGGAQTKR
jgi:hypothetical protein